VSALIRDLFTRSLFVLFWWVLGLVLMGVYVIAIYDTIGNIEDLQQIIDQYPESIRNLIGDVNIGTIEGWIHTELMSWVPLVIGMYGGIFAAGNISKEAEQHTLDFVLGLPISRTSFMASRLAVGLTNIGLICLAVFVLVLIEVPLVGHELRVERYAIALINAFLLGAALYCVFVLIASFIDDQARVIGIAIGGTLVIYIATAALKTADAPDFIRWLSPFEHYRSADAMSGRAVSIPSLAVLAFAAVIAGAGSLYWYNRRDLTN
jgi:ABC-2 type transport system permease protein